MNKKSINFSCVKSNFHYYDNENIKVECYSKHNKSFNFIGHGLCHIERLRNDIHRIQEYNGVYHIYFNKEIDRSGGEEQNKIVIDSNLYESLAKYGLLEVKEKRSVH
ncbi:hypothetical protein HCB37_16805 [Listeria booriae]|uniref:hypothetical protein n=1 Tax=Listeria booriae TaxID=1552123 RepID=UPI001626BADD|nr:hypothetical protein [Listeria booriae]MBC2266163.1 hypothetical protein [Listeria booriae]